MTSVIWVAEYRRAYLSQFGEAIGSKYKREFDKWLISVSTIFHIIFYIAPT